MPVDVRVNAVYPVGATRSTVPPSLLLALPPLPECLHYRFVGRDLLLVDSVAQIIVDFLTNAAPAARGEVTRMNRISARISWSLAGWRSSPASGSRPSASTPATSPSVPPPSRCR